MEDGGQCLKLPARQKIAGGPLRGKEQFNDANKLREESKVRYRPVIVVVSSRFSDGVGPCLNAEAIIQLHL